MPRPLPPHPSLRALFGPMLAVCLSACGPAEPAQLPQRDGPPATRPALGLMSTLPIYWPEGGALTALGGDSDASHWAREALERSYRLVPVDALDASALQGIDTLVLAQPRALSGPENVALDDWVRAGGHVLIFADPLLSGETAYPLGDPRRPQDVALLDPILARWGLRLLPPSHDTAVTQVQVADAIIPVASAGRFAKREPAGGASADCVLEAGDLMADCRIGTGRVVAVADATLLEAGFETPESPKALRELVGMARDGSGDNAGTAAP
ncbi:Gldg family protein [Erythrobacter sp. 3-20A1M]|uniref:Gldg family protein n=1 Tax=Erythrobacter sp. 3-20A1M TaxID=2653850 RepID=UPI001BFC95D0|nr:Gldg family protein [Erythrobacter sp. 3-20A1M]